MEVKGEGEFQQHTPTSSDLDPGKNIADEIVRVLEGSLKELRVAVNRELDLAKAKRQIDALVRQTADSPVRMPISPRCCAHFPLCFALLSFQIQHSALHSLCRLYET